MTKLEAVRKLVSRIAVRGVLTSYDYDPAGSSSTYEPDPKDLAILEALTGRPVTEADLWFTCGGSAHPHYAVRERLVNEIALDSPAVQRG